MTQEQLNAQILKTAKRYLGVHEIRGEVDNPLIVKWFEDAGAPWIKDDESAWCSAFACGVAREAGAYNPRTVRAQAWMKIPAAHGLQLRSMKDLVPGDFIVVTRGEGLFHVTICHSKNEKWLMGLGGNQVNSVNVSPYDKHRFVGGVRLFAAS